MMVVSWWIVAFCAVVYAWFILMTEWLPVGMEICNCFPFGMWYSFWSAMLVFYLTFGQANSRHEFFDKNTKVPVYTFPICAYLCLCKCVCLLSDIPMSSADLTVSFTTLLLKLSLKRSHLLRREFSAFFAANAIHNSPIFVTPGTHHC